MQAHRHSKGKHPVRALIFLTNPTVMLLAVIGLLFSWRIPTQVQIDLVVKQTTQVISAQEVLEILQSGENSTIVIQEGAISYPGYPDMPPAAFVFPKQIEFKAEGEVTIEVISLESANERQLRINGRMTLLRTGSSDAFQDQRLRQFDNITRSPQAVWIGIGAWLVATAIGWYRLYQELQN